MAKKINTQERAKTYRARTLRLLAKLGYASTSQVAIAVWGECTPAARTGALRVTRWLLDHRLVVARRDGASVTGERLIALTAAGVQVLAGVSTMPSGAAHARDWLRHAHPHRTACNSIYAAQVRGLDIEGTGWTELEIRALENLPLNIKALALYKWREDGKDLQKIPDVLLDCDDKPPIWIEAENAWRSAKDFDKLVSFVRSIFASDTPPVSAVWCVVTAPGAKNIGARLRAALTHIDFKDGATRQTRDVDAKILDKNLVRVRHLTDKYELLTTAERTERDDLEATAALESAALEAAAEQAKATVSGIDATVARAAKGLSFTGSNTPRA